MSKKRRKNGGETPFHQAKHFVPKEVQPLTDNQRKVFEAFEDEKQLLLHGSAGTGKTFISLYLALNHLFTSENPKQKKISIIRSIVPTRDVGFLPGTLSEKIAIYEAPYRSIINELFGRGDAYDNLKSKGIIEFISTSFVRGITIRDSIIIVDEIQNCVEHELDSIITRIGENSRIIFCGDIFQTDLKKESEVNGVENFLTILDDMPSFESIEFNEEDIVRSGIVREYLLAKNARS